MTRVLATMHAHPGPSNVLTASTHQVRGKRKDRKPSAYGVRDALSTTRRSRAPEHRRAQCRGVLWSKEIGACQRGNKHALLAAH